MTLQRRQEFLQEPNHSKYHPMVGLDLLSQLHISVTLQDAISSHSVNKNIICTRTQEFDVYHRYAKASFKLEVYVVYTFSASTLCVCNTAQM